MRIAAAVSVAFILIACGERNSARAEKELAIIQKSGGDVGEQCRARRKIADAYLAEQNQPSYESAKLDADVVCRRAAQEGLAN